MLKVRKDDIEDIIRAMSSDNGIVEIGLKLFREKCEMRDLEDVYSKLSNLSLRESFPRDHLLKQRNLVFELEKFLKSKVHEKPPCFDDCNL